VGHQDIGHDWSKRSTHCDTIVLNVGLSIEDEWFTQSIRLKFEFSGVTTFRIDFSSRNRWSFRHINHGSIEPLIQCLFSSIPKDWIKNQFQIHIFSPSSCSFNTGRRANQVEEQQDRLSRSNSSNRTSETEGTDPSTSKCVFFSFFKLMALTLLHITYVSSFSCSLCLARMNCYFSRLRVSWIENFFFACSIFS
jgi:hypothetical protein